MIMTLDDIDLMVMTRMIEHDNDNDNDNYMTMMTTTKMV